MWFFFRRRILFFYKTFPFKPRLKIGYLLFYKAGLAFVEKLINDGYEIFLDLKLCDTPSTISNVADLLKNLKIKWVTIHPWTGFDSVNIIHTRLKNCATVLVPFLTTINDQEYKKIWHQEKLSLIDFSIDLLDLNRLSCHAVICSIQESKTIKKKFPKIITICPGGMISDQNKKFLHARNASLTSAYKKEKVDYLVVGRTIINSDNPLQMYKKIYDQFNQE
ncbi:orotidine 5'-phosphate decarboxylase / HUMPS family protein [Mycoplasma sp. SG1]|uniref:orotidine 5'-phosphate decarboxylase / HUMPS family protein n=1 Tax=Mycoplasma sp. SG1 TaxID=2810348 RepID=UPI0020258578|nr:orotidine 5'-phosphate decarboxylase / HUMPS family protein [Mycoplasma sp. SG1]URM52829.1 orotidine 5'-phosphate decarboxylase [Mycoplasma sp. SG1]